eukprot:6335501-Prymnesium_polylepis.1
MECINKVSKSGDTPLGLAIEGDADFSLRGRDAPPQASASGREKWRDRKGCPIPTVGGTER